MDEWAYLENHESCKNIEKTIKKTLMFAIPMWSSQTLEIEIF